MDQKLEAGACEEVIAVYERWKVQHPERAHAYDEAIAEVRQRRALRRGLGLLPAEPSPRPLSAARDVEPYEWRAAPPEAPGGPPMEAPDPSHPWYAWCARRLNELPDKWYKAWQRGVAKAQGAGWPTYIAECWAFRVLWPTWRASQQRGGSE